jgi:hypothetical protein
MTYITAGDLTGFDLLSGAAHHWRAALFGKAADLGHD